MSSDVSIMMQYDAQKKSSGTSYVLWFFVGIFGAHRFYLEEKGTAKAMLIITLISFPLMAVGIGFVTICVTAIWALVDAFLIPGMIKKYNSDLATKLSV